MSMPFGPILDVLLDRNWMYRVDKKELAKIFGVDKVKIGLQPEIPDKTYSYKDADTGRILFMASRMGKKSGFNLIEFLNKNEKGIVKEIEFDIHPGATKSFCCKINDEQMNLIIVKNKAISLMVLDGQKEKMLRVAKHFEEKNIF